MADQHRLRLYAFMKLARDLDLRFASLLKTGRVGKWYSQIGTEATSVPAGLALETGDVLCSLHRDLGAILAVYLDPARTFPGLGFGEPDGRRPEPGDLLYRLCCQLLGRQDGFSNGVERSFHYSYLEPDASIRHLGMISHLGAMVPVAAGAAFALKRSGTDRVALNFIGDGGTSTGDFHEGLNMAAVWKLPLILIIENNRYAFSTPTSQQYAARRLSDRGVGYGIAAETVDGNHPERVAEAVARAVARARAGEGPTLIEAMLGRMRGHSEGDDSLKVVPKAELEGYLAADPVPDQEQRLEEAGILTPEVRDSLESSIGALIDGAVKAALEAPPPAAEIAMRPVFASLDPHSEPQEPKLSAAPQEDGSITYVEAVHRALVEEMEHDERVVLMGQDIARFEGAFRVTRGLWRRWPNRVLDTPIAESGTLGIAAGAALLGYRPVVEMQFADFISCGFNQLVNVIAKLYYRWQVSCPLVVRLPAGGGVGAGPFHSQNPEAWFAHTAGLKVVCPATVDDAKGLLQAAIRDPNPVIFCEHKYLYRRTKAVLGSGPLPALGEASVRRPGRDLVIFAYGASVWTALEAAEALASDGIETEVVDLRTLVPLDEEAVVESARRCSRALIVHEAQGTAGFGAEVAALLAERAFPWLDAPLMRVTYPDRPVPFAKPLEQALLPGTERLLVAAHQVLGY